MPVQPQPSWQGGSIMTSHSIGTAIRRTAFIISTLGMLASAGAALAQAKPDFDAVAWNPLTCSATPLTVKATPGAVDMVGDATYAPSYYAYDATYLYFRYRVDRNPAGSGG